MYIRWVKRGHKNNLVADVIFHDAYLVESYRNDGGKPRQRTISYLGNIRQIGDDFPIIERELFLLRAEYALQSLPELSPVDCEQLLEQLHLKVAPLTRDEMMEGFRNTLRWYYRWWKKRGEAPTREELRALIEESGEGFDLW